MKHNPISFSYAKHAATCRILFSERKGVRRLLFLSLSKLIELPEGEERGEMNIG